MRIALFNIVPFWFLVLHSINKLRFLSFLIVLLAMI